jgi:hypothetical protein
LIAAPAMAQDHGPVTGSIGYTQLDGDDGDLGAITGRLGYGTTSIKADVAGFTASEDGESVNYGAGANWYFDGRNGLRADWTRRDFQDDGAGEVDTYGLSYVRRF